MLICSTPHLVIGYFFPHTHTHMYKHNSVHCTHPPPRTVPTSFSIPIRAHLAITSPPPHRNQFRLLLHTVMACWPREMESFQVPCYNLPPSLLSSISPSLSLVAAPSLLLNISSHAWCISRVARQHDRTAPENLWELFCTLCDLLKFLQNCVCVCVCVLFWCLSEPCVCMVVQSQIREYLGEMKPALCV